MLRHAALFFALVACTGAPADDTGPNHDSGDPAPCDAAAPGVNVRLSVDDDVVVGPEDLLWRLDGDSGYCLPAAEGEWLCDTNGAGGMVEIEIRVSGHLPVTETVEVTVGDCENPRLDVTLENLGPFFEADRAYFIQLIPDPEECASSWELYGMNCYATAVFCADGDAEVVLTDIAWRGVYGLGEPEILGFYEGASGEIPDDLSFAIVSDTEIVDTAYGETWTLDTEDRFAPTVCREGGA